MLEEEINLNLKKCKDLELMVQKKTSEVDALNEEKQMWGQTHSNDEEQAREVLQCMLMLPRLELYKCLTVHTMASH